MMLGVSGLMGSSGDGAATAVEAHESGGASGGSSEVGGSSSIPMDEIERSGGGGNRWPRQETIGLLKIRSDMDVAFRDASLKGPLWEEVSRKMAELGFQRSAKKCKEKFENVYKYHKRTKDGRASKPDGKSYRFFDQLAALENTPPNPFSPPTPRPQPPPTTTMAVPPPPPPIPLHATVSSISPTPLSIVHPNTTPRSATNFINSSLQPSQQSPLQPPPPPIPPQTHNFQTSNPHFSILSNSTSSSTSSDEDIQRRSGRKRKWKDYLERLMKEVIHKQEELQKKFLDALEKRERDRMVREEAWRGQEIARMNREHDLLVKERSVAAAKDAAVIAFLQKVTDQHNLQIPISNNNIPPPQVMSIQVQPPPQNTNPQPVQQLEQQQPPPPIVTVSPTKVLDIISKTDNGGDNFMAGAASSSRWPKAEVQTLINLRTSLDLKYQENGPKGPLWEEISAAMSKAGYKRNAKRCKEKWENINKYFKKVKESNKKRPEDSKTCPYFHQLEAIYKERANNPMLPIMARPEQQWPLSQQQQQQHQDTVMHDRDHHHDNESHEHEEDDDEEEDDEEEGASYEIIASKQPQPSSLTN